MKTIIKFAALAAIALPLLASCSGGGSSSTPLFGSLAGEYAKYAGEKAEIKKKAESITTEEEKAKLIKESNEMQEEWRVKIENAAKSLDGKPVEIEAGDFTVVEPITLTFDDFFSKKDLTPTFKVNGKVVAAKEIDAGKYILPGRIVYVAGYDAEGQKLYSTQIGTVDITKRDGNMGAVAVGTPIKLTSVRFSDSKVEEYLKAVTLKLELDR